MTPQALSILNNAKIFLSDEELKLVAFAISKELGETKQPVAKKAKRNALIERNWNLESCTERLIATVLRPKTKKIKA